MTVTAWGQRLGRLLRMSPRELGDRSRQACRGLVHRAKRPTLKARGGRGHEGLQTPFRGVQQCGQVADELWRVAPGDATAIVDAARDVLEGKVSVLGVGRVEIGDPPAWQREPTSGRVAPARHWRSVRFTDPAQVGDCKVVWEVNRHQFLVTLGQAYQLTGDGAYAARAWDLIGSWIADNPPEVGINWASSLEAALRAIAWCWTWHLAEGARFLDRRRTAEMQAALAWHGRHVELYLSTYFSPNTHLTGEALALCYLGTCLSTGRGKKWWRTGSRILERELASQVHDDGMHFERSSCYHLYTLDFYLHYAALRAHHGLPLSAAHRVALRRMAEVAGALQRPDQRLTNVGDEDGGRLLFLGPSGHLHPGASLAMAASLLEAPDLWPETSSAYEAMWLLGVPTFQRAAARGMAENVRPHGRAGWRRVLPSAGFVSGGGVGDYLLASVGIQRRSRGCSGHVHDDALSVELWCKGRPVLVDPGTYTYTGDPARRQWYRSAAAHNAVTVVGCSTVPPSEPFQWNGLYGGLLDTVVSEGDCTVVEMHRRWGGERSVVHRRRVVGWHGVGWIVWDRLEGGGDIAVKVRYQLPVELEDDVQGRWIDLPTAHLALGGPIASLGSLRVLDSPVSPRYGELRAASALLVDAEVDSPADLIAVILNRDLPVEGCWADTRAERPEVRCTDQGRNRLVELVRPDGTIAQRVLLAEVAGTPVEGAGSESCYSTVWQRSTAGRQDGPTALLVSGGQSPGAPAVRQLYGVVPWLQFAPDLEHCSRRAGH